MGIVTFLVTIRQAYFSHSQTAVVTAPPLPEALGEGVEGEGA